MREQIQATVDSLKAAVDSLTELHANVGDLAKAKEDLATIKTMVAAAKKEHDEISAKLSNQTGLLDKARDEANRKYDTEYYTKTQALRQLTHQVEVKQAELDEVSVLVKDARRHHDEVLASFDALRKRLA